MVQAISDVTMLSRATPNPDVIRMAETLASFLALTPGWDSYGARPVAQSVVSVAVQMLAQLLEPGVPVPNLFPTPDGGVQAEWHINQIDLEIEFISPGRLYLTFGDLRTGEAWDGELSADLKQLVRYVRRTMTPAQATV